MKYPIATFWWLWLPAVVMAVQIALEIFLDQSVLAVLHSENGPHELLQFAVLLTAFIMALKCMISCFRIGNYHLLAWIFLAAAGCFYVAGEEISWGQQFFGWATPELWSMYNDQNETNLHNTSSWLDQKPRLLLLAGVIIGGLLIPLLRKLKPSISNLRVAEIFPPDELWVIAAVTVIIKIADKIGEHSGLILFERASEVEELYLYYFISLYIYSLCRKSL